MLCMFLVLVFTYVSSVATRYVPQIQDQMFAVAVKVFLVATAECWKGAQIPLILVGVNNIYNS